VRCAASPTSTDTEEQACELMTCNSQNRTRSCFQAVTCCRHGRPALVPWVHLVQPVEHGLRCCPAGGDGQEVVNQTKQDRFWSLPLQPGRLGLFVDATLIERRSLMMLLLLLLINCSLLS